jgi:NAD(P)H-flavin reductase
MPPKVNSVMRYHVLSLSAEQLEARAAALDQHGLYAWLSPFVLLGIIYGFRHVVSYRKNRAISLCENPREQPPSTFEVQRRRLAWWLDQPLSSEFGARKAHVFGAAYTCWLLLLTFHQTGDDYLHLTRQFGQIAVSQLPFQYMMAIKSPRNPVQFATGLSHETLNPYHRLLGRIIHLFLTAHAALYMSFFITQKILVYRLMDWDVCLGVSAFCIFTGIVFTALSPVRRFSYHKRFYRPHILLSGLLMPALFLHVPATRKYVYQMAACYIFNGLARTNSTSVPIAATVTPMPGTSLIKIRVPGPAWGVPPLLGSGTPGWVPGQHIYVKQSVGPDMPRSPFTVVSLPPREGQDGGDESSSIDLVVRVLGGPNTAWLAAQPAETGLAAQNATVFVEGPYGQARRFLPQLLQDGEDNREILLVAGGVGATFTVPVYLTLLARQGSARHIRFVWFVKTVEEAEWGLEMLRAAVVPELDATVYVTKQSEVRFEKLKSTKQRLRVLGYEKRPAMKDIVDAVFSPQGASEKNLAAGNNFATVSVLACGPRSMMRALRKEVGGYVMREGRNVWYHEEVFGLGM